MIPSTPSHSNMILNCVHNSQYILYRLLCTQLSGILLGFFWFIHCIYVCAHTRMYSFSFRGFDGPKTTSTTVVHYILCPYSDWGWYNHQRLCSLSRGWAGHVNIAFSCREGGREGGGGLGKGQTGSIWRWLVVNGCNCLV